MYYFVTIANLSMFYFQDRTLPGRGRLPVSEKPCKVTPKIRTNQIFNKLFFQGTRTSGLRQAFTPPGPPPRVPSGKRVQNYAFLHSPPNFSSTFFSQFPQPSNIKHTKQPHNPLQYIILQQNGNAEFFCGNFIINNDSVKFEVVQPWLSR